MTIRIDPEMDLKIGRPRPRGQALLCRAACEAASYAPIHKRNHQVTADVNTHFVC